jgi:hypothetical protein
MEDIIDGDPNEYNWELYFRINNVIVPRILKDLYRFGINFYVKGGKAVDAYLSEKIGSPDWDIIVNTESFDTSVQYITSELQKSLGKRVKIDSQYITLKDLTGIQIGIDYDDLFWAVDVFPSDVDPSIVSVIDGIPYLGLSYLIEDLKQTSYDRAKKLKEEGDLVTTQEQLQGRIQYTNELKNEAKQDLLSLVEEKCGTYDIDDIKEMLEDFEETVKQESEVLSYENISAFKSMRKNYEKLIEKTKRTKTRLVELLSIGKDSDYIQLSKEFLVEVCDYCSTNVDNVYPNTDINCKDILVSDSCKSEEDV